MCTQVGNIFRSPPPCPPARLALTSSGETTGDRLFVPICAMFADAHCGIHGQGLVRLRLKAMLNISLNSGAAFASLVDGFSRRFGRLWPLAWLACGLTGFFGLVAFAWLYLIPSRFDMLDLVLGVSALCICLVLGPSSMPAGPVMIAIFVLFDPFSSL